MPSWLWWLVGFIVVAGIAVLVYAGLRWLALRKSVTAVLGTFPALGKLSTDTERLGLPLGTVDAWRAAVETLAPRDRAIAGDIERQLVTLLDRDRKTRFKLRDGEQESLPEGRLTSRFLNVDLVDATPGFLTALGLIGTFAAIAFGLGGLRQLPSGVIEGVQGLLGGLGGKFISSIAALGMALLFQVTDVAFLRPALRTQHRRLLDGMGDVFPRLSPAQQAAELLETSRQQEASLANISSDVVGKFSDLFTTDLLPNLGHMLASSVQAEMGPVLERVATGITALDEGIRRLESGKQESIGAELRTLTTNLETSIRGALEEMGTKFRESLSGAAGREFDEASNALKASAQVLGGMNESFEKMQASLERMLEDAEERASKSYEEGEGRTKALNELVERLVGQLSSAANESAGKVQQLLVDAVSGMSAKLAEVTTELERKSKATAEASLLANRTLIDEVTSAAGRTSSETTRLLASIGERAGDFTQAADQLKELRQGVQAVLAETGQRVREIQEAATGFRSIATEAAAMTRALRESQEQQRKSNETAAQIASRFESLVQDQATVTSATKEAFTTAGSVLDGLDERLDKVLGVLNSRMQDYNVSVEKNFERILKHVNERMPELYTRLEASIAGMTEQVEELGEVLGRKKGATR